MATQRTSSRPVSSSTFALSGMGKSIETTVIAAEMPTANEGLPLASGRMKLRFNGQLRAQDIRDSSVNCLKGDYVISVAAVP